MTQKFSNSLEQTPADLQLALRSHTHDRKVAAMTSENTQRLSRFCLYMHDELMNAFSSGNESKGRRLGRECADVFSSYSLNDATLSARRLAYRYGGDWMDEVEYLIDVCGRVNSTLTSLTDDIIR